MSQTKQTTSRRSYSRRRAAGLKNYVFPHGYSPAKTAGDCRYDPDAARRALNFTERFVIHTKGDQAGQPFFLERWEAAIIAAIYGWKRPDGRRRYRIAFVFIARKNGKSKLAEAIALIATYIDGEPGAEVCSIASTRGQAALVFDGAKQSVERSTVLSGRSQLYRRSIVVFDQAAGFITAQYNVLSSDAAGQFGPNPSCVIADEIHAHKSRALIDALRTGQGNRRNPLFFGITTAGEKQIGIGREMYDHARNVATGVFSDPAYLPVLYEPDPADDWRRVATWKKANPNYGVSVQREFLAEECRRAQRTPALQRAFEIYYLNRWLGDEALAIRPEDWSRLYVRPADWPDLAGVEAFCGVDLAHSRDLCAFVIAWNHGGRLWVRSRFWIPEKTAIEVEETHSIPYRSWSQAGHITLTAGDTTDYGFIREEIKSAVAAYKIRGIGVDPYNATHLLTLLKDDDGIASVAKYGQNAANMNEPYKDLLTVRIPDRAIAHDGNPVLSWNFANTATKSDRGERWRPIKTRNTPAHKIDGVVALTMANGMRLAINRPDEQPTESIYNQRGVLAF